MLLCDVKAIYLASLISTVAYLHCVGNEFIKCNQLGKP